MPVSSLARLLELNTIEPGDTIYIDTGLYVSSEKTTLTSNHKGTSNSYVTILGNPDPTNGTVLTSHSSISLLSLNGASYMQVADITLNNASYGISQDNGGFCIFSNLNIAGASTAGLRLRTASNIVTHCRIWNGTQDGILNDGKSNFVTHCALVHNAGKQLHLTYGSINLFNSIICATGTTAHGIYRFSGTYHGDYNNLFATNGACLGFNNGKRPYLRDWQSASGSDSNSLTHNPMFVDASSGDFHLRSSMPSGTYVNAMGSWTNFAEHSPCIDGGPLFGSFTNEPAPAGDRINIGPDGNTAMASLSLTNEWLLATGLNDGGPISNRLDLAWLYGNMTNDTPVDLEYYRGPGESWQTIATNIPVTAGSYSWTPTNLIGSPLCLWRVISASATDTIDNVMNIHPYALYINDNSTNNDIYCSATGGVLAAGVSSNDPHSSVLSLLTTYDLDGGDTIYIDTGTYNLSQNLEITSTDSGSQNNGYVSFVGSTNDSLFIRNSSSAGTYAFYLNKASYIRLANLKIGGGYNAIYLADADRNIVTNVSAGGSANAGISLYNADGNLFTCLTVTNCSSGISGTGNENTIRNTLVYTNSLYGIRLQSTTSNILESCTLAFNGIPAGTNGAQLTLLGGLLRNSILAASHNTYCLGTIIRKNQYAGDYNNFYTDGLSGIYPGYNTLSNWQAYATQDIHSLAENPCFVDSDSGDFHLKSSAVNGTYVISLAAWTNFSTNSPCIDTGDISMQCDQEPMPNGGMINIGAYANTPQASLSVDSDNDGLSDTFEIYARDRKSVV